MRIRELDLERFGHFTDRKFDFGTGEGRPDFHIIYGPNEAGKTTTMEAALRLFYGFPTRENYAFKHQRNALQVSATLDIDGVERRFTRLPKRNGALIDETGTTLPETALSAHLAGLSETDYRQLLCLDDETIERGGEEIANAQGDIGRLLFSAAAGVADLSGVLDGVRDQADELWKKRGRTTRIAELKRELSEVEKTIRERDVSASAWKTLKTTVAQSRQQEHKARSNRDALIATKARNAGQRRALPLMYEIKELEEKIALYPDCPNHLGFDPERLIDLRADQGLALQNIKRLGDELADMKSRRDLVALDPARLDLARKLDDLRDLSARDRGAQLDLERRQNEVTDAKGKMQNAARDLGASSDVDPKAFVLPQADISALETAREAVRDAMKSAATEAEEVADLVAKLETATMAVAALGDAPENLTGIGDVLQRFDVDRLAPACASATQAIIAAKAKARLAMSSLSFGAVSFDTLPICQTSQIQAQRWAADHDALSSEIRITAEKRDEHSGSLSVRSAQTKVLTTDGRVIPDADAKALRQARDQLWAEHKMHLSDETADAFETSLHKHDAAMTTRVSHASELGQLRQIELDQVESQTLLDQCEKRLASLKEQRDTIECAVEAAARAVGLPPAVTPAEWQDWVTSYDAARAELQTLNIVQEDHHPTLRRAEALFDELGKRLPFAPLDLDGAITAARRTVEEERILADRASKAQDTLDRAKSDLEKRQAKLELAKAVELETRKSWCELISDLFAGAVLPETMLGSLEPLHVLREEEKTRSAAAQRIAGMQADQKRFAQEIETLAQAHDLDTSGPAAEIYATLGKLSDQARTAKDTLEKLGHDIETTETAKSDHETKLEEIKQEVAAIAALFPAPAPTEIDQLRQVAAQTQQVIEDRAALVKLRHRIMSDLGVEDMSGARDALAGATGAELDTDAESTQSDLDHAERDLTQAIESRVAATQALAQVTGDADIAALVEQKATLELQLEEAALEHLELSLGHTLASNAIRRYRDSHRNAMMTATEHCFASLTHGAYPSLITQPEKDAEVLLAIDANGASKRAAEMSKGTRFQLYLALRAAAYEQLVSQGTSLPFFCDDIFETFDEGRTSAACRVMETIGTQGQAIYLTHHRHVVDIAMDVCDVPPVLHEI